MPKVRFEVDVQPEASHPRRDVLASPSGAWFAIAESGASGQPSRLRVVDASGTLAWSTRIWSESVANRVSWSADGTRLAVAADDGRTWTAVIFAEGMQPVARTYELTPTDSINLAGFSTDGSRILGWADVSRSAGLALDLASGTVESFQGLMGGPAARLAVSNRSAFGRHYDPHSGRWLLEGEGWSLLTDGVAQPLDLPVHPGWVWTDAMWGADGSLILLETSLDTEPPSNEQLDPVVWHMPEPAPGAAIESLGPVGWAFSGPFGSRSRASLLGSGGGSVVVGISSVNPPAEPQPGWDGINLLSAVDGSMLSLSFEGERAFDMHFGGLVR
jgi:hypothetical protein